ncbi:hypothetical protein [Halobacillus litoralis]|uniref:hypothetical protein n=1 Tax=Halobacillus litoralis TaxID=45668 RepID=UPI001CFF0A45|nr:hypothetical protein [Halobacillus litoralis]
MFITGVLLVPLFLFFTFVLFTFAWGKAGKTEKGRRVLNQSLANAAPILPIGWLIIESYHGFIHKLSYSEYRDSMWVLVMISFIYIGISILSKKRKDPAGV